jgi:hypothetical protein
MRLLPVPTYATRDRERIVQFFPVEDRVLRLTSSHRVVINGVARDWLSASHRPNAKAAQFFLDKHAEASR